MILSDKQSQYLEDVNYVPKKTTVGKVNNFLQKNVLAAILFVKQKVFLFLLPCNNTTFTSKAIKTGYR